MQLSIHRQVLICMQLCCCRKSGECNYAPAIYTSRINMCAHCLDVITYTQPSASNYDAAHYEPCSINMCVIMVQLCKLPPSTNLPVVDHKVCYM